jgi:hypothetical protein
MAGVVVGLAIVSDGEHTLRAATAVITRVAISAAGGGIVAGALIDEAYKR